MQNDIQQQILGAFLVTLRPIAKLLLRFGIGFREFSEVAKTAFVDVASNWRLSLWLLLQARQVARLLDRGIYRTHQVPSEMVHSGPVAV